MNSGNIFVLDVGHGSSTVVLDDSGAVLIDVGGGAISREFLQTNGVKNVSTVIISHADADHIRGLLGLLAEKSIAIADIYMNVDVGKDKDTPFWDDLQYALRDARKRGDTALHMELSTSTKCGPCGGFDLLIKWPVPEALMTWRTNGASLDSNEMSAVVMVERAGRPVLLAPGDLGSAGLDGIEEEGSSLESSVLLFPHHGGRPGKADPAEFAERVCNLVRPEIVLFSIGRGRYRTPRPEIVQVITKCFAQARIACTQLSKHCAAVKPDQHGHLLPIVAAGIPKRACCGGSFVIEVVGSEVLLHPRAEDHRAFIEREVATALCARDS